MSDWLEGKVALVTGGSRGIGRAIAEALLDAGASVVICSRQRETLERALKDLGERFAARARSATQPVAGMVCDVRDYAQVQRLVQFTVEMFGGVDILINNAGVGIFRHVAELTPDEWNDVIATNLTGVFYCCREVVPVMRQRGGGYIINISSLAGRNAFAGGTAYNASKFGLNGFTEALMHDLRYENIRVSVVMPGSVNTEFGGRTKESDDWRLRPEDVARVVMALLQHDPRSLPSSVELRPAKPPRK
ncbi:MAG TPA: SDR family oxidoreductase [Blastocatellia bacterium]|nr:SDR family oxidoreductase [Blastocatellia bacterium]